MNIFGFAGPQEGTSLAAALLTFGDASGTRQSARLRGPAGQQAASWGEQVAADQGVSVVIRGTPLVASGSSAGESTWSVVSATDLLHRYFQQGEQVVTSLRGRFALAIVDSVNQRVVLAVDTMGIESLAFAAGRNGIIFATSAKTIATAPGQAIELNRQALFDYLLLHMVPAPDTVYRDIHKLAAGTCAVFAAGTVRTARYWTPGFISRTSESATKLGADLHDALATAVRDCGTEPGTGAFLSGGLDSSTVSGMLGKVSGVRPQTFSIGFGVAEFNEIEYARIAAKRFDAVAHEYNVTPEDIVSAFPKIAAAYDEPFGNSSAVPTYFCAQLAAANGIHHLLAGDGGDEIFAGNERYSKQRVFERYQRLPVVLRKGLLEPVADRIPPDTGPWPVRKFRSYVEQARIPMPERLEYWNFMNRADLGQMLVQEFRSSVDPQAHLRRMNEVYHETPSRDLTQCMLYFDWQYTLANNDLRKVGTMCELARVQVSYPMLHPAVIDVSIRVPPSIMIPGGKLRDFYKKSMQGFLPDEILNKSKHGFGLPFGTWLKTHKPLSEMIYGLLTDLKQRRIILPEFIDRLIEDHRLGHASYFGYAIWDLAMLEAWLSSHGFRP
jgi:asparagine synthase (glutamine-hydrolysing)